MLNVVFEQHQVAACHFVMTPCRAARTRFSERRYSAAARGGAECLAMYPDIDEARVQHAALREIVERHVGAADWRALQRVLELCRRAAAAIDDRYCRDKLRLVEDFSAEMFSHGESRVPLLKQRILDALDLFASRLYSLEAMRRAPARASVNTLERLGSF